MGGERRFHARKRGVDIEGGPHRPLGIIAVGNRRPEYSHDPVADVLVDGPAIGADYAVDRVEISIEQRMRLFRVESFRQAREPGQISEQDRDFTTLALWFIA